MHGQRHLPSVKYCIEQPCFALSQTRAHLQHRACCGHDDSSTTRMQIYILQCIQARKMQIRLKIFAVQDTTHDERCTIRLATRMNDLEFRFESRITRLPCFPFLFSRGWILHISSLTPFLTLLETSSRTGQAFGLLPSTQRHDKSSTRLRAVPLLVRDSERDLNLEAQDAAVSDSIPN